MVASSGRLPRGRYNNVKEGVHLYVPSDNARGMVQNIDRYVDTPITKGRRQGQIKLGILNGLLSSLRACGASEADVGVIVTSTSDQELSLALGQLRARLVRRATTEKARKDIDRTIRGMQRADFLHNVFEPARLRGVHAVNTLSAGLVSEGAARPADVLTSGGSMALMTPVGAAPERGTTPTPEHLEAERPRYERVGQVVLNLIRQTRQKVTADAASSQILINSGKTDLAPVGVAAQRLLTARFGNIEKMNAAELEKNTRAFQSEVVKVLISLG